MAVFFLFLRNVLLPIEILKIKILEHSDPPSQHFSVHNAFSHSFFCRGKVVLCHPAEWHTAAYSYWSVFRQILFQTIRIEKKKKLINNYYLFWIIYVFFSILIGSYSICLNTDQYEYAAV